MHHITHTHTRTFGEHYSLRSDATFSRAARPTHSPMSCCTDRRGRPLCFASPGPYMDLEQQQQQG